MCVWVTVRLICFRARAQRSGTRNRNRERREADYDDEHEDEHEHEYEYEWDSYVESCNQELNQAPFFAGKGPHALLWSALGAQG